MSKRIIVETTEHAGIPLLTFEPEGELRLPTIFFMHGFFGCKEHGLELGFRLARHGFFVVSFDAAHHGMRSSGYLDRFMDPVTCVYPPESGLDMTRAVFEVVEQNGRDLETLMAHYTQDDRADPARYGVTGVSVGGYAAFYAAATNSQVQAAAPLIGIPAFVQRWDDVVVESSSYDAWRECIEGAAQNTRKQRDTLERLDPFPRMSAFAPRPLFMASGDQDHHAPKHYSVSLYRRLQPEYATFPERLKLKIYDGIGHNTPPEMLDDVTGWFARWLI